MTAQTLSLETGHYYPVVDGITAAVYQIPTDQLEAEGTLA